MLTPTPTHKIEYTIVRTGSPSFPVFTVWKDVIDEEGYTVEHLCEPVSGAKFRDMVVAAAMQAELEEAQKKKINCK
jgi:hypothetical protein